MRGFGPAIQEWTGELTEEQLVEIENRNCKGPPGATCEGRGQLESQRDVRALLAERKRLLEKIRASGKQS